MDTGFQAKAHQSARKVRLPLIAAHRTRASLDADRLARWLAEVEGWSDEAAHELAIDYEFGLGLLKQYDASRP